MSFKKNIMAFIIIGVLGTVSHFVYEWSGENIAVGLFFPVSESVWEHLKLLFYPTLVYSAIEYFTLKEKPENYIPAVAISLYCGMFSIVAMYYIYTGITGLNSDAVNIAIFFISVIVMLFKKRKLITKNKYSFKIYNLIFFISIIITALLFGVWSYNPPSLGIFMQPIRV